MPNHVCLTFSCWIKCWLKVDSVLATCKDNVVSFFPQRLMVHPTMLDDKIRNFFSAINFSESNLSLFYDASSKQSKDYRVLLRNGAGQRLSVFTT